jgi:hypothetical protein
MQTRFSISTSNDRDRKTILTLSLPTVLKYLTYIYAIMQDFIFDQK